MLCAGQTATLSVIGGPFNSYAWSTGENTPTIETSGPGLYTVYVENAVGCIGVDDLEILSGTLPPILNAPDPICSGQSTIIEVLNASLFESFLWSTGETTSSIIVNTPGTYSVTATAPGGCSASEIVVVENSGATIDLTGITLPVTSCTNPNGSVDLTVTPSGSYTFN
ncbi:MAG: hypothetical protein SH808_12030 [Saprospiraceae bacterium]|nr:hypothetical protein [Saprospiraceae bacterium]